MKFVSIGPYCKTAEFLISYGLKPVSYPFDYIFSSLDIVRDCLEDKFAKFLDKSHYAAGDSENSTKHTYYSKYLDTPVLLKHHLTCNFSEEYKVSSGNFWNHHDLINKPADYEAFQRRANRLLDLIKSGEKVVFVYYNCYTKDTKDVIDFANSLTYPTIFVLAIFENDDGTKILYNAPNCRIYQNFDRRQIFEMTLSGV